MFFLFIDMCEEFKPQFVLSRPKNSPAVGLGV